MKPGNDKINQYRLTNLSSCEDGNNGAFLIRFRTQDLRVIASDGLGWDHVSVSLEKRNPNWEELCFIKDLFWEEEETVIQFHPKKSEYVNNHPYCLHLWKNQYEEHQLPPGIFTGIKRDNL